MGSDATKTSAQLNEAFAKLAKDNPKLCRWREVGRASNNEMTYALEITNGIVERDVAPADLQAVIPPPNSGKIGVLFVAGVHGTEPQPPEGLLDAAEMLVKRAKEALGMTSNQSFEVNKDRNYTSDLETIKDIVDKLDILIYPNANPEGHKTTDLYNAANVDINRNFPILWNGLRDGRNPYFKNGFPPSWNAQRPGAAPKDQPETQNIIRLMDLPAVSVYIDLHTGRPYKVMYPWAFHPNGTDDTQRFCNPNFASLPAQPNDGTTKYKEYMPRKVLSKLTKMGLSIAQSLNTGNTFTNGTKVPAKSYEVIPASIIDLTSNAPDPSGGTSIDTIFAQDPCHVHALHLELGSFSEEMADVAMDVRVVLLSVCEYVCKQSAKDSAAFTKVSIADPMTLPCSPARKLPCQNPPVEVLVSEGLADGSASDRSKNKAIEGAKNVAKGNAKRAAESLQDNIGCTGGCSPIFRVVVEAPWETDPQNWNPVVSARDVSGDTLWEATIAAKWKLYVTCQ